MAVLLEWRGQRVGESLLSALVEKARKLGLTSVTFNAQISAEGFYEKFGFSREGEVFMEADIPHRTMRLPLQALNQSQRPIPKPRDASVQATKFETSDALFAATLQIITTSRRQLCLYSRDLEFSLYGQKRVVEALKQFVLGNRNAGVQIIVQERKVFAVRLIR